VQATHPTMSNDVELKDLRRRNPTLVATSSKPRIKQRVTEIAKPSAPLAPYSSLHQAPWKKILTEQRNFSQSIKLTVGAFALLALSNLCWTVPSVVSQNGIAATLRYLLMMSDSTTGMLAIVAVALFSGAILSVRIAASNVWDSCCWPEYTWKLVGSVPMKKELNVLDIGAAGGLTTIFLHKAAQIEQCQLKITALDTFDQSTSSAATQEFFNSNIRRHGVQNVKFINWNLDIQEPKIHLQDSTFDWVVANLSINTISNVDGSPDATIQLKLLQEAVRVLKPGGILMLFDEEKLVSMLAQLRVFNINVSHQTNAFGYKLAVITATKVG
jgi:SAM-dependent methyltransferase